ncbi:MAG: hypothetical protein WCG21_01660 [Eubacteriales bacterium]
MISKLMNIGICNTIPNIQTERRIGEKMKNYRNTKSPNSTPRKTYIWNIEILLKGDRYIMTENLVNGTLKMALDCTENILLKYIDSISAEQFIHFPASYGKITVDTSGIFSVQALLYEAKSKRAVAMICRE